MQILYVGRAGKVQHASLTAAAEVGMALESEAVASAVREADFERMQREAAEAGVASLQDALEKLRQKLKTAQVSWMMLTFDVKLCCSRAVNMTMLACWHRTCQQFEMCCLTCVELDKDSNTKSSWQQLISSV